MNKYTIITLVIVTLMIGNAQSRDHQYITVNSSYPCPFTRELSYVPSQPMTGQDVYILQSLLERTVPNIPLSATFDELTEAALKKFQSVAKISSTGVMDINTATVLLDKNLDDGYKDNGEIPPGFLYKVHVPVYRNRSIETNATLFDSNLKPLLTFTVKTLGQSDSNGNPYNELCPDGATPTGLYTFDLNSPEDDPADFGPYPVNRAVEGLAGNAYIVISNIRDGILLHTGEWAGWTPSQPMPPSHGCIHSYPTYIDDIWQILTNDLGVYIRNNTFGQLPYPYHPQGILSVELID
ncbi:hypothetical protein SAMD00019534_109410, partial [Acytostelium subglobosum LB1]|uniref:hypothetical protein n=1 Tax=Acytostelium subglobosum LB1 TaxID=1410327 RepID=UPI0006449476